MNIRTKLIAWLGFSTAIVLIITTFALVRIIGKETTELINSELESNMQATTSIVNTAINNSVKSYLRAIADNGRSICQMYYEKELSGELTHEQAWRSARNLIVNPIYGKVGETGYLAGVSTKGILAMHPLSEGVDASGYEFMQQAMLIKNGYLEYNWKNKDETVERAKAGYLSYFEPWDIMIWASSYKEELLGLIKPEDFRDEVLSIKIGDTGYPYIIDMSGTLVIHPSLEGKNLYNTPDANGLYFIKEMIDDEDGQGYTEYSWQNPNDLKPRDKFQKYERLDDYGWIVAISSYKAEFNSYQNNIITILILGVLISLIVIILAVILISKKMSGSIHKIQSIIGNLENGDFSNQYTIHGSDEFAQMVSSSNNMSSGLNQSVNQIKDVVKINRFLSDDLASHSTEVSATVTEMSASMDTMKSGLTNINNQLQQSDDGLQTIQTNVGKVVVLIDEQGQSVNESSSAIEQMLSSITSIEKMTEEKMTVTNMLTALAKKGETNMLATVTSINEIEEYTVSILDLINIINNVAAQTNLLAMNAAIEAAHAGQYGRGFSVVADEIRKLAETAAQNSKNVSISLKSMTEKIKTASNQSVETNNTFKEIITGIGDVSTGMQETLGGLKEMATGSQQITLSMNTLHQMTGNVREAGDLMGQGIEEIYNAQVEVNSMMGNYLNTISEVAEGSNEISKAMVQLSELSTKNQEAIERLESSIAKFKTTDVN